MRVRSKDPAVIERRTARRQRRRAVLAAMAYRRVVAVALAVLMIVLVAVGASGQFGIWWGMIITGCLCGLFALLVGWE